MSNLIVSAKNLWALGAGAVLLAAPLASFSLLPEPQRRSSPEIVNEVSDASLRVKRRDSTWITSKMPRVAAELFVRSSAADKGRLAKTFFGPDRALSAARGLRGIDPSRLTAMATNPSSSGGGVKWSQIAGGADSLSSMAVGFGTHTISAQAGSVALERFDGVASTSGVLTVDLDKLGPFAILNAFTTTGSVTDKGEPEVFQKMVKVAGNKLRAQVLEGQGYRIEFTMPVDKLGTYSGSVALTEQTSLTLNLSGSVVAPKASLSASFQSSQQVIKGGTSVYAPILLNVTGPQNPGHKWTVTQNPGNFNVSVADNNIVGSSTPTAFIAPTAKTKSGTYPLTIEVTAYSGTQKAVLTTNVTMETFWITTDESFTGAKLSAAISSDGDFGFVATPTSDLQPSDDSHFLFAILGMKKGSGFPGSTTSTYQFGDAAGVRFAMKPGSPAQIAVGKSAVAAEAAVNLHMKWTSTYTAAVRGGATVSEVTMIQKKGLLDSIKTKVPVTILN